MTSVVTNGGETTVSFGYDAANRQIFEDQTLAGGYATHRISTPRDADGKRQWLDAAGINHMVYQYNERNQLAHILNGSVDPFYDFSYDPAGNETQRQSRVWYTSVSNFAYDELNRVTMGEQGTSGWIFARSWYQYDKAGRELATWRDENHGLGSQRGERFGYAADNQVVSVVYDANNVWAGGTPSAWTRSVGYGYSADTLNRASVNDNGVVTSYSPNALNQYQTFNGVTYNYDYNFNLREAPNWWGVFDAESRLTMAGGGGSVASFTYDGLGRCVRRIVYPPGGGSNTVIYAYDGWKPVLEFDAAGNYRASNVYGSGADEILFRWDTVYGGSIYKQDRQGNIVAVLDQWGNIAERYSYDAFGKATIMSWWDNNERTSSWIGNRFMFQGREWLNEFGIYDYRHRMYNPRLGRFIQTDPTGFDAGDMNLFRYCDDDPVDRSDPTGLEFFPREAQEVEVIKGEPGLSGLTVPKLNLSIDMLRTSNGFILQSKVDVIITRQEVATTINGRPLSRGGIDQLKVHEEKHESKAKEWHDANQNKIPNGPFKTEEAAKKAATEAGEKLKTDFDRKMEQDKNHKPDSVWKKILEQDKLKVR
jgi:RHS repeat-associated protein